MSVREGVRNGFAIELCPNDLGDEGPTLLGRRCQSGYGLALPTIGKSGVADYVDVGQAGDGKIGLHLDAARLVGFRIEPFRGGGWGGAPRPQKRSCIDWPGVGREAARAESAKLHFEAPRCA